MEAMPCRNQRLGPAPGPQDEQQPPVVLAAATGGGGGGCSRLIRFAEPDEGGESSPSPDSSSGSNNDGGVLVEARSPAAEIGAQLKLLPMNDQIRELQTIIRDK